jgi:hypothetical protein
VLGDAPWLSRVRTLRIRDTQPIAIGRWLRSWGLQHTDLAIETSMADFTLAWLANAETAKTLRLEIAIGHGDAAFSTTKRLNKLERFVVTGSDLTQLWPALHRIHRSALSFASKPRLRTCMLHHFFQPAV